MPGLFAWQSRISKSWEAKMLLIVLLNDKLHYRAWMYLYCHDTILLSEVTSGFTTLSYIYVGSMNASVLYFKMSVLFVIVFGCWTETFHSALSKEEWIISTVSWAEKHIWNPKVTIFKHLYGFAEHERHKLE